MIYKYYLGQFQTFKSEKIHSRVQINKSLIIIFTQLWVQFCSKIDSKRTKRKSSLRKTKVDGCNKQVSYFIFYILYFVNNDIDSKIYKKFNFFFSCLFARGNQKSLEDSIFLFVGEY